MMHTRLVSSHTQLRSIISHDQYQLEYDPTVRLDPSQLEFSHNDHILPLLCFYQNAMVHQRHGKCLIEYTYPKNPKGGFRNEPAPGQ